MVRRVPIPYEGRSLPSLSEQIRQRGDARTFKVDLATARDRVEFKFSGRSLWALDFSGSAEGECEVFFAEDQTTGVPFGPGQYVTGLDFATLFISNTAQSERSITFLYSQDDLGVGNKADIEVSSPANDDFDTMLSSSRQTLAVGTGTLIAANSARRFVEISTIGGGAANFSLFVSTTDPAGVNDHHAFYYTHLGVAELNDVVRKRYYTTAALYYSQGTNVATYNITEFG